jgi:hypothetical protein
LCLGYNSGTHVFDVGHLAKLTKLHAELSILSQFDGPQFGTIILRQRHIAHLQILIVESNRILDVRAVPCERGRSGYGVRLQFPSRFLSTGHYASGAAIMGEAVALTKQSRV